MAQIMRISQAFAQIEKLLVYFININQQNGGKKMAQNKLDPELLRRIDLVEDPAYEGEPLTKMDYTALIIVGIIIPFLLMVGGWIL